jgi:hypothetical protein
MTPHEFLCLKIERIYLHEIGAVVKLALARESGALGGLCVEKAIQYYGRKFHGTVPIKTNHCFTK